VCSLSEGWEKEGVNMAELELDRRRRANLARFGRKEHEKYLVDEYEDGTLVLTPAVTISAVEFAALTDPAVREVLDRGPRPRSELRTRGSGGRRNEQAEAATA
jgi:hypothetical protein